GRGGVGGPPVRLGARHLPAAAFPRARSRDSWRSAIRKLPALERSAAGEARRKRPRVPAGGAYVRGAAAPPDREPRLARQTEGAGGGRGRSIGSGRSHPPRAHVLRIA